MSAQPLPLLGDEDDDDGGGQEHRDGGQHGAEHAVHAVADERDHEHGGAGRELGECVAVHEFARGHPLMVGHDLALHFRNDAEAAAHAEQAQPEKRPRYQQQVAHWPGPPWGLGPLWGPGPPWGPRAGSGRFSQRPMAVMTTMTAGVLSLSGPTAGNVAAAVAIARPPGRARRALRSGGTATSPPTDAPIPRNSGAPPGGSPPRQQSAAGT